MRAFLCNSLPPPSHSTKPSILTNPTLSSSSSSYWVKLHNEKNKLMSSVLSGALSFTLLLSSPSLSSALDSTLSPPKPLPFETTPSIENCREDEKHQQQEQEEGEEEEEMGSRKPQFVSNETIVEEAWQIVNDSFLDTRGGGRRRPPWSPQSWQQKKDDIMGSNIHSRTKAYDLIRKMLASLGDPYTRFLSPDEFSKMARYDMTGIGINIREIPDTDGNVRLKVLGLLLDGPAQSAGMRQGDEILAVNGEDMRGKSAFQVSSLLQGPSGTSVTIKVKHGDCGPVQFMEVQRQLIARTPVFYRLEQVENGSISVGYVRLKEFNALAQKDLVSAMKRLQHMGASYFILDLRDNLGGLVQAGIEIAKLFLVQGETVIYTVGRDAQYQNTIVSDARPLVLAPVVVLVNNKTASASEIVASALHDNCRAVLVGERTYGKGLIQSVFELDDGSGIVVTVGKYVTPNHKDINGNGIDPDYRNLPAWSEVTKHLSQCTMPQQG